MIERFDIVSRMTRDEARACVQAINGHLVSARALLFDLYERRGWEQLGYTSWMACVTAEFEQNKASLWRQLQAAQIEQRLELPIGNQSEWKLRPLAALPEEDQPKAWAEANTRSSGKPTARVVTEVVQEMRAPSRFSSGMRSSDSPQWYTPAKILDPVRAVFGAIDTDPCSHADAQRAVQAARYYTEEDNGLIQPWEGRAFVNPPYGDQIAPWIPRLIDAYESRECSAVIALLPGRTDTDWFSPLFNYPICFVHGRLTFSNAPAAAPFPSVVVYLGCDLGAFRRAFAPIGRIMLPDGP